MRSNGRVDVVRCPAMTRLPYPPGAAVPGQWPGPMSSDRRRRRPRTPGRRARSRESRSSPRPGGQGGAAIAAARGHRRGGRGRRPVVPVGGTSWRCSWWPASPTPGAVACRVVVRGAAVERSTGRASHAVRGRARRRTTATTAMPHRRRARSASAVAIRIAATSRKTTVRPCRVLRLLPTHRSNVPIWTEPVVSRSTPFASTDPYVRAAAAAGSGRSSRPARAEIARLVLLATDDPGSRGAGRGVGRRRPRTRAVPRPSGSGATRPADIDASVRRRAAELAPAVAVRLRPLLALLSDADWTVVEAAAWAIGEIGGRRPTAAGRCAP